MQNLSDEQLMLNYQEGEALAMDEILRRYKNPIYRFALRLGSDTSEAEDIAQEVFLRIHEFRANYRVIGKFSTWIFGIAHNLCISRLRKKKGLVFWPRKENEPDELVEFESPCSSPQEEVSQNEFTGVLKKCIQSLPFLQKEALILCEYQKLGYQEIAKILNKPLGTIKILIYRARQNLKVKLLPYLKEVKGGYHE
ncbi:MAG: sigma-70 family RNA polymerase sigma factor [Candidatus Omnitrophota bacterium]|nr:sigma-70 family RNA polymerase sigma factor [Candidatus Omnitrophota bacterium]